MFDDVKAGDVVAMRFKGVRQRAVAPVPLTVAKVVNERDDADAVLEALPHLEAAAAAAEVE